MENETKLVVKRTFNAPRSLVFNAWTQPEHLQKWWAPEGFTAKYCSVDLREGGLFRYCMSNGEVDFWGKGTYTIINKPHHIQYTDVFSDKDGNDVPPSYYGMQSNVLSHSLVDVTFEELNNQTLVTITVSDVLEMGEEKEMAVQGWNVMFDKLEKVLAHS
jgi:uncharacterized protein YndB with AHSA1/START domain